MRFKFLLILFITILITGCVFSDYVSEIEAENGPDGEDVSSSASEEESESNSTQSSNILLEASGFYKSVSDRVTREFFPVILKNVYEFSNKLSPKCIASLTKIAYAVREQKTWALRFLDSSGKLPNGLIGGTITDFGDYDECLNTQAPTPPPNDIIDEDQEEPIYGQYCLALIKPTLPPPNKRVMKYTDQLFNLTGTDAEGTVFEYASQFLTTMYTLDGYRIGVCAPTTCSSHDIEILGNKVLENFSARVQISKVCDTKKESKKLSSHQKVSLAIVATLAVFVMVGTAVEIKWKYCSNELKQGFCVKLVTSWSAIRNTQKLFHYDPNGSPELFTIHGIKVFTMLWIMVSHTYLFGSLLSIIPVPAKFSFQPIFNAYLLVDTFFFLSGLLLVYSMIPVLTKKKGRVSFFLYMTHRMTRLFPSVIGALCFHFLWPTLVRGPPMLDSKINEYLFENCHNYWWTNLLFLNNWLEPTKMCLIHTWYVSADMQLYVLAFGVLLVLYRYPRHGLYLTGMLLIVSILGSALITGLYNLAPTVLTDHTNNMDYLHHHLALSYCPTFQHLGPYCIGIFTGYLLLNKPLLLNEATPFLKSLLWAFLPSLSVSTVFLPFKWNRGTEPTLIEAALYSSLHRTVWSLGVAWVTFACVTGHGGIVSRILKSRTFLPLSRLSFGVYLVHLIVIYIRYFTVKQTIFWSDFDFVTSASVSYAFSLILAYFLYVLFESPLRNLEKLAFSSRGAQKGRRGRGREEKEKEREDVHSSGQVTKARSSFYCHCKEVLRSQGEEEGAEDPDKDWDGSNAPQLEPPSISVDLTLNSLTSENANDPHARDKNHVCPINGEEKVGKPVSSESFFVKV